MKPHYETLGVAENATEDEIKKAYRKKAKTAHSDREGGDDETMSRINVAYTILSDPEKRAHYDRTGEDRITPLQEIATAAVLQKALMFLQSMNEVTDMIGWMVQKFEDERNAVYQKIDHSKAVIAKINRAASRIKYKGTGNDIIRMLMDQQLAGVNSQMSALNQEITKLTLAIEIAKTYDYTADPVIHSPFLFGGASPFGRIGI